ncbi:leucine-rich repeat domain-containing protein [Fusibacter ferrireducens]|uniref:Leucine-rich repeat domain-containing protein n=1 Tax=Fusibacter ferrireducens TaxID=2785058 RepID=A0ABR9ZWA5_9FIRM|nr:leucine-rich repeat domain-containing protein [Fusibacter ferrireducens]MBF4694261.1 leucine-rich repeat domain-containing protein [Fusibacter ferrireducens]
MKKVLFLIVTLCFAMSYACYADEGFYLDGVNGKIYFDETSDKPFFSESRSIMVPGDAMAQFNGGKWTVNADGTVFSIELEDVKIEGSSKSDKVLVNGQETLLENKPISKAGKCYLPFYEIDRLLGLASMQKIDFDNEAVDSSDINSRYMKWDRYVPIADEHLLDVLCEITGSFDNQIRVSELKDLWSLDLRSHNVEDIDFVKYCSNLSELILSNTQITDISPLKNLKKLQRLDLDGNYIVDLSPIADLTELEILDVSSNDIKDISCLKQLRKLKVANFIGNDISDISMLKNAILLEQLYLSSNQIEDISPLAELEHLNNLWLSNNRISDLSVFAPGNGICKNLQILGLNNNLVTDVSDLQNIQYEFLSLYLSHNKIEDISTLGQVKKLQGSEYTQMDQQGNVFRNFGSLNLSENQITDISPLKNTKGHYLNLSGNRIENIDVLSNWDFADSIKLSNNQIVNIGALSGMENLNELDLSGNQIEAISPLLELKSLKILKLGDNQISDLSCLSNHDKLEILSFYNNQVKDLSFVKTLENLERIHFEGNPIPSGKGLESLKLSKVLSDEMNLTNWRAHLDNRLEVLPTVSTLEGTLFVDEFIELKDKAAQKAINQKLHHDMDMPVLRSDVQAITELSFATDEIKDYSFLKSFDNLRHVWVKDVDEIEAVQANVSEACRVFLNQEVIFDDPQIESAIRHQVHIKKGPVYTDRLSVILDLKIKGGTFTSLGAIKDCINLVELTLDDGSLKDLSGIENLKDLVDLSLDNNQIDDISLLGELDNLVRLYLENNKIDDIKPLKSLVNLEEIDLDHNKVEDITVLKELDQLIFVFIRDNLVSDADTVEFLRDRGVYVHETE